MTTQTPSTLSSESRTGFTTWRIDPIHSSAQFGVKHMMVATVKGVFRSFEGTIEVDEHDPQRSSVEVSFDVSSIDTGEARRDDHLRSNDFFNAALYPTITFRSTRIEQIKDGKWRVTGDLTIRDITRPVVLDLDYEGEVIDAWGKQRRGFSAETSINRQDWGLKWNGLVETGSVVVGDKVKSSLDIAAVEEAAESADAAA